MAKAWQYGYGEFDEASNRVKTFERFPHFTGSQWQGGPALPDPALGWAMLSSEGGHVGNNVAHAAIRRWTAPSDGSVRIEGTLRLTEDKGDGVRGRLVASRSGKIGEWIVEPKSKQQKTVVEKLHLQQGDTIDFVADLRTTIENDSFAWPVTVQLDSGVAASAPRRLNTRRPHHLGFRRELPPAKSRAALQVGALRSGAPDEQRVPVRGLEIERAGVASPSRGDPNNEPRRGLIQMSAVHPITAG